MYGSVVTPITAPQRVHVFEKGGKATCRSTGRWSETMGANDMERRWERGNFMSSFIWALHQLVFQWIPSQESDHVSEICKFRGDTQRKHVDSDANGLLTSKSLAWDTNFSTLWCEKMTASKHICKIHASKTEAPQSPPMRTKSPCRPEITTGTTKHAGCCFDSKYPKNRSCRNSRYVFSIYKASCVCDHTLQYPTICTVKADIVMILWVFLGLALAVVLLLILVTVVEKQYRYYQYLFYSPYWLKSRTTWDAWNLLTY